MHDHFLTLYVPCGTRITTAAQRMRNRLACALSLAVLPACSALAGEVETSWAQRLRDDAQHLHAVMRDNHPGAVDPENPRFAPALDDALRTALVRAGDVRDAGGYWWALRELQASFDDGHVQLSVKQPLGLPLRWAGVLTRYRNGRHVVAVREEQDATLPPLGAALVSCDGTPAAALAAERLGRFSGRWHLLSQQVDNAPRLLMDEGNPWAPLPQACIFEHAGVDYPVAMRWRSMNRDELAMYWPRVQPASMNGIGLRTLPGGITWISLGSFSGNADAESYPKLTALLTEVEARQDAIRRGPIVLDVRGNGGGSSHWSQRLAETIWGEDAAQRAAPRSDAVDWRVSAGNIAHIRAFRDQLRAADADDAERLAWANEVLSGMETAQRQGLALWRQTDDEDAASTPAPAPATNTPARHATAPRVYVLTDSACASACLDAMDLWKALGIVQVGGETSADTTYMEIRGEPLPSGLVWVGVPTKVYRGRKRGANEAYRPDIPYGGDLANTAALQAWIAGLAGG